jgi:hypothetical protein
MFYKALFVICFFSFSAMAESVENKDFGLDYRVGNAYLELIINDLPIVDPGFDIGSSVVMESSIDFKYFLYDGDNNFKFITRKIDESKKSVLDVSFKSWDEDDFYMPFELGSNGFDLSFDYENKKCAVMVVSDSITVKSSSCSVSEIDNGYLLNVDFSLGYEGFYKSKYISEAVLVTDYSRIKSQIIDEYKEIYSFYEKKDSNALEEYLSPMLNKQAEDADWSKENIFTSLYGKYLLDEDFELSDFDLDGTYIYITGDKKIFSIVENSFKLENNKTSEFSMPIFYFWLDKGGNVRIKQ